MGRAAAVAAFAIGVIPASAASALAQEGTRSGAGQGQPDQGDTTDQSGGDRTQGSQEQSRTPEESRPKENPSRAERGRAEQGAHVEVEADVVSASATIQKIDKAGRKLALQDPNGQTFDLKAGPDVDFSQLHVGDRVNATYFEEVAVAINKHAEAAPRAAVKVVQRGGVTAKQATVTAKIVAVDAANDTVTVRGVDGRRHTLQVSDPQLQAQLASVKAGDNVDVTYTQAVAIAVEPAAGEPTR
jgi:hypothetical protein